MSAPVSSFQKLSLSQDMQSSRDQARGQSGKGKGKAPMGSGSAGGGGPASLARILNPNESDEEVVGDDEVVGEDEPDEGTRSGRVFALDHCRQFDSFYAFQIAYAEVQRISIRISTAGPICSSITCGGRGGCRHVIWLLEQLSHAIPDTVAVNYTTPFEQISATGLELICEDLNFELREDPGSDTEDTWQLKKVHSPTGIGRKTRGMIRERMHVVRDIMATLSGEMTDDYRNDIFDSPEEIIPGPVLGDLEATITRVLFFNDDIFYHFKTLVSHTARAKNYFREALHKAEDAIEALKNYCEHGPLDGPFDLIWCANTLISLVDAISLNVVERQPLASSAKQEAARALVGILDMVVNHNYDSYSDISWDRRRAHAEPQIDRNLYERLIRSPPRNDPAEFVLNTLQNLPEAKPFIEQLRGLLTKLEGVGWGAPLAYRSKLQMIIAQLKGVPLEAVATPVYPVQARSRAPMAGSSAPVAGPGASSGKRARGSSDKKANKRMK